MFKQMLMCKLLVAIQEVFSSLVTVNMYQRLSKLEFRLLKVNCSLLRISKLFLKPDGRVVHYLYTVKVPLLKRLNRRVSSSPVISVAYKSE